MSIEDKGCVLLRYLDIYGIDAFIINASEESPCVTARVKLVVK